MTTTIRLADYRAFPFRIEQVDLTFRLVPTATRVQSRLHLVATDGPADLRLDGENLLLIRAAIDGQDHPHVAGEQDSLVLVNGPQAGLENRC
jgi:aminopeptidase N